MKAFRRSAISLRFFVPAILLCSAFQQLPAQVADIQAGPETGTILKSGAPPRIVEKLERGKRVTLEGHVRPFLNLTKDHGAVEDSVETGPIMMMFSRTAQQQADLDALIEQLHNKNSAQYHQWLTPQQFGVKFGPADSDVAIVRQWLQSEGFTVLDVVPAKTFISFTGTIGQLKTAFGVSIHRVTINGESHMATTNEPQIPAALAPVVAGLHKLDDFSAHALVQNRGLFKKDAQSGKSVPVASAASAGSPRANFTDTSGGYQLAPQDFYTVYNENPLLSAGITGAGQTIAVIEQTQVNPADVTSFRSIFGLPAYAAPPTSTQGGVNYLYGSKTGLNTYASCYSPYTVAQGKQSGDEGEADLDLQWAGSVAPAATVDFVACGGTATKPGGTALGALGIDHAAQYIANYLYNTVSAASMSYGECEADMNASTTSGVGYYNLQWQQYAAEGITAIVSSGDGGAEQCYQNAVAATTLPPSVNGLGSSAYNVSAGGTDFGDNYETNGYKTTLATAWWNPTNGPGLSSAISYVPETTWSGYCSNPLFASYLQANQATVFGTTYTPEGICSNATAKADGYVAVVGGAGGISTFNTIPSWQSVYGIGKNSVSTTMRNLPDVSLFAANGFWGHLLPYCESDQDACTVSNYNAEVLGAGGTSFVAPQLAGFMALVDQKTSQRQGQANYTFYGLAAKEYGSPSVAGTKLSQCSGSAVAPGQAPPSSCLFYDVSNDMPSLQGGTITPGNYQPCVAGNIDCYTGNGGSTYGVNTVPGTLATAGTLAYTASPGYDNATGLGSLNINAVVQSWSSIGTAPLGTTSTTLAASSMVTSGVKQVTLTATVTFPVNLNPTGTVDFFEDSIAGKQLGSASFNVSCGTDSEINTCGAVYPISITIPASSLPTGTVNFQARFDGNTTFGPSVSNVASYNNTSVSAPLGLLEAAVGASTDNTLISSTDNLYVTGWAADPVDGAPLQNTKVYIDGNFIGVPYLGDARPNVASTYNNPAYLNSGYHFYYPASNLAPGTHTVTVISTNSAGLSTTYGPATITIENAYPQPVGNLDSVLGASSKTTSVSQSDRFIVTGWAADPIDGTPLPILHVLLDGNEVGSATQGISRPDVVVTTGNPAYANAGFTFNYSAAALSPGTHQINVVAVNSHLVSKDYGPLFFMVTASQ